ncbi:MAG: heavy-metal-associated domain-containing protein [Lachnospiraceae bacterium]|nr:heavy-metal-associated domain-containing protein [Lachnospiraceae bacterium]
MNIPNIITVAVSIFLVAIVCIPLVKRMRTKVDCCGNEQVKVRAKKLKHAAGKYTLTVEGMHCKNCEKRVTEAINDMDGLACRVSLERKEAVVSYESTPRKDEVIKKLGEMNFLAY